VSEKKPASTSPPEPSSPGAGRPPDAFTDDFLKQLKSGAGLPAEGQEILNAALKALNRPSVETDVATSMLDMEAESRRPAASGTCDICGHQNRPGNQFCGMCGLPLPEYAAAPSSPAQADAREGARPSVRSSTAQPPGVHFYHHHYHHHYFPAGAEAGNGALASAPRASFPEGAREAGRVRAAGGSQPMSRAEAAVRKVMQDWALACNTKHLDDLADIYASDAIILRPNHPPVRGTAAIREFFVAILDAGFGEAELDPVRLEVFGDIAYEAGRCKALVPVAVSKRREERGKYLTLLARQSNGEWKIISDCWSSDLSLSVGEPENARAANPGAASKAGIPRKPL
jgi:uncharacterized protein (TIGR02246 family)